LDIKINKIEKSRLPNIDFSNIQFGKVYSDHMFMADYIDGQWSSYSIVPYDNLEIAPGNFTLHYGQSVFEGLKGYKGDHGNIHVFSDGDAFVSDLILQENSGLELWELQAYFLTLARLQLTVLPSLPHSYDSTGHIDMWFLPVRDREVIVGRYRAKDTSTHRITEQTVSGLVARGYRVHRTPGWRSRGSHYTYTNSLIFNDLVFVPSYQSHSRRNTEALDAFQDAFPEKQVIPVESSRIISFEGALHCAVLQIPEAER